MFMHSPVGPLLPPCWNHPTTDFFLGRWFQIFSLCSPRTLGKMISILTNSFQMGWNHKLFLFFWISCFESPSRFSLHPCGKFRNRQQPPSVVAQPFPPDRWSSFSACQKINIICWPPSLSTTNQAPAPAGKPKQQTSTNQWRTTAMRSTSLGNNVQ